MANEIAKIGLERNTDVMPGFFTTNYAAIATKISNVPQVNKLGDNAQFTTEFKNAMLRRKSAPTPAKVKNVPNSLPLLSGVIQHIGPYGAIYMRSVLQYCQYYKKTSPPPKSRQF